MVRNNNFKNYGSLNITFYTSDSELEQGFTFEEFIASKKIIDFNLIGNENNDKFTFKHSLWDSGIIEYKNISLPNCLNANQYSVNEMRALQYIDVVSWATDSRAYLPQAYKTGGNKINDEYVDACVPIIENQIFKAGIRLAGVLNEVFKN